MELMFKSIVLLWNTNPCMKEEELYWLETCVLLCEEQFVLSNKENTKNSNSIYFHSLYVGKRRSCLSLCILISTVVNMG